MMTPEEKEQLRFQMSEFPDPQALGTYEDQLFNWFLSIMEEREDLFISAGYQLSKALELEKKANKDLEEKLEAAEKVVDLINDTRIISVAAKVENIQKLKSALEHYYKSLKG